MSMGGACTSCRQAPIQIVEVLDDPAEPYQVCADCYRRLTTHSLRPHEWYRLSSIHGRTNDFLSEEYYCEDDGRALEPEQRVVDAELFPCPVLEDVAGSVEALLTYILTRSHFHEQGPVAEWRISEDLVAAMQKHSTEELLSAFTRRLGAVKNVDLAETLFHLVGLTLGTGGSDLVRENWEKYVGAAAFRGLAFAASHCLPLEEAHQRVTLALSRMDPAERCVAKHVLEWLRTQRNLDWIEQNASSPVDSSWGLLAASSDFDWERARKWLSQGRPLSLVALDALDWCVCSGRKPALVNPPGSQEFTSTLEDYLSRDDVLRVRERVQRLLAFTPALPRPAGR
jgi:hypothetical protein